MLGERGVAHPVDRPCSLLMTHRPATQIRSLNSPAGLDVPWTAGGGQQSCQSQPFIDRILLPVTATTEQACGTAQYSHHFCLAPPALIGHATLHAAQSCQWLGHHPQQQLSDRSKEFVANNTPQSSGAILKQGRPGL